MVLLLLNAVLKNRIHALSEKTIAFSMLLLLLRNRTVVQKIPGETLLHVGEEQQQDEVLLLAAFKIVQEVYSKDCF